MPSHQALLTSLVPVLVAAAVRQHLGAADLTEDHAAGYAWSNLDRALRQAQVTTRDVDGVRWECWPAPSANPATTMSYADHQPAQGE